MLDELWQSTDPGIPYTLIAGNTSLFMLSQNGLETQHLKRLIARLQRLFSRETLYRLADLAFFDQPNDLAVAVSSIKHLPMERSPKPAILEIAYDHLSYFSTKEGLEALATALAK